jgi:hypothetical protein
MWSDWLRRDAPSPWLSARPGYSSKTAHEPQLKTGLTDTKSAWRWREWLLVMRDVTQSTRVAARIGEGWCAGLDTWRRSSTGFNLRSHACRSMASSIIDTASGKPAVKAAHSRLKQLLKPRAEAATCLSDEASASRRKLNRRYLAVKVFRSEAGNHRSSSAKSLNHTGPLSCTSHLVRMRRSSCSNSWGGRLNCIGTPYTNPHQRVRFLATNGRRAPARRSCTCLREVRLVAVAAALAR